MFDFTWTQLAFTTGVGFFLIGRKDLPAAARLVGTQVGRLVGLLQGARARADQFASQNELKQLQNELRSGLRELDAVKSELVTSLSGRGFVGRGLGATVASVNRERPSPNVAAMTTSTVAAPGLVPLVDAGNAAYESTMDDVSHQVSYSAPSGGLATASHQLLGAVAEDEWKRQGIAFTSRAEQGAGLTSFDASSSGSALLSNLLKDSLIYDQYDRIMKEQDDALQSRFHEIKKKVSSKHGKTVEKNEA